MKKNPVILPYFWYKILKGILEVSIKIYCNYAFQLSNSSFNYLFLRITFSCTQKYTLKDAQFSINFSFFKKNYLF